MKDYKWEFRLTSDWTDNPEGFINIDLLSFHWEDHTRWISILGIGFIWDICWLGKVKKK